MTRGAVQCFEEDMRIMRAIQMTDVNPKHYDLTVKGHKFQTADLMEARFAQDAHLAQALKYLMRAGRKPETPYIKDVGKCLWWCAKAIIFHGGIVELPEDLQTTQKLK